jgi:hypothetical protein
MDATNEMENTVKDVFNQRLAEIFTETKKKGYLLNYTEWSYLNDKNESIDSFYCAEKCLGFMDNILSKNKHFSCVQNFTKIVNQYGCQNLQLISDNRNKNYSNSICVNISLSIPFFHIHVLHLKRKSDNFSKWAGLPIRDRNLESETYVSEISKIKHFLKSGLKLNEMPDNLIECNIPWLYNQDVPKGHFNYFQAFFQREFYTR